MKLCVNPHTRCYGFLQVYENTAIRACVRCVAFFTQVMHVLPLLCLILMCFMCVGLLECVITSVKV